MNMPLERLAHLVQIKNELNRKRRRFYHLSHPTWKKLKPNNIWARSITIHPSFPVEWAKQMYEATKLEMKAMTPLMREVRKQAGASLVWSDHGAISAIQVGEQRLNLKEIAILAEMHLLDEILLG